MDGTLDKWSDISAQLQLQWVVAAREGDTSAFEELVVCYESVTKAYARCLLGNDPFQAEDIAQESFLIAFRELKDLRDPARFSPWLKSIVWRQCKMWVRGQRAAQKRQQALPRPDELSQPALLSTGNDDSEPEPWLDRLEQLIDEMGEGQKAVLELFYIRDMSYNEIAAFLDIPISAVKRRLFDGRKDIYSAAQAIAPGEDNERRRFAASIRELLQERSPQLKSNKVKGARP